MTRRPRYCFPTLAVFLVALTTACEWRDAPARPRAAEPVPAATAAPTDGRLAGLMDKAAEPRNAAYAPEAPPPPPGADPLAARKLIRTGQLTLEVRDYAEAAEKVAAVALAGRLPRRHQSARGSGDRRRGTLTIRNRRTASEGAVAALNPLGTLLGEA
jgi:hypothetical protein